MTASSIQAHTLEVTKTIKAPPAKVFKAWTEAQQMKQWFGCEQALSVNIIQDFRVGGEYRIEMNYSDRAPNVVVGKFIEIVPNKKVVYTWTNNFSEFPAEDTLVSVQFNEKERGTQTEILLQHTKFATDKSAQGHTMGWQSAIEKLSTYLDEQ